MAIVQTRTPVGDSLAVFDFSLSVNVFFLPSRLPFRLFFFFFFTSGILIRFLPLYEAVNSLRGGSAVITTVMSGGAEERSLGRRKATVR